MEVILLDRVDNLGKLGDKVKVKNGYARNFLIPSGKAKSATSDNLAEFELRRAELEQRSSDALQAAQARAHALQTLATVTLRAKAGSEGKLFGSIGTVDIVEAVKTAGIELERREVRLPSGNLRETGEYEVELHLHTDVSAALKVIVEGEE